MLLYDFAVTPDAFDPSFLQANSAASTSLTTLLDGIAKNGLLANLHGGQWKRRVLERVQSLPDDLHEVREDLVAHLELLDGRGRLVKHRRGPATLISSDAEWLTLARSSNEVEPFQGIVLGDPLFSATGDPSLIALSRLLSAPAWRNQVVSARVRTCVSDYQTIVGHLLRYAEKCHLIDPYLNPRSSRTFNVVPLAIAALGKRRHDPIDRCSLVIYTGDPTDPRSPSAEGVRARLGIWERELGRFVGPASAKHRVTVYLQRDRRVADSEAERIHDRYIISDIFGVSVQGGLDCTSNNTRNTTPWSRVEEVDRADILGEYAPNGNVFDLLGELYIDAYGSSITEY